MVALEKVHEVCDRVAVAVTKTLVMVGSAMRGTPRASVTMRRMAGEIGPHVTAAQSEPESWPQAPSSAIATAARMRIAPLRGACESRRRPLKVNAAEGRSPEARP